MNLYIYMLLSMVKQLKVADARGEKWVVHLSHSAPPVSFEASLSKTLNPELPLMGRPEPCMAGL